MIFLAKYQIPCRPKLSVFLSSFFKKNCHRFFSQSVGIPPKRWHEYCTSASHIVISLPHFSKGALSVLWGYFRSPVVTMYLQPWPVLVEEYGNRTQAVWTGVTDASESWIGQMSHMDICCFIKLVLCLLCASVCKQENWLCNSCTRLRFYFFIIQGKPE